MIRIVRMYFRPEHTTDFLSLFNEVKQPILARQGCRELRLLCDLRQPEIMSTYSVWDTEGDLEAYRNSDLFISTWNRTKVLFSRPAEAWSMEEVERVGK